MTIISRILLVALLGTVACAAPPSDDPDSATVDQSLEPIPNCLNNDVVFFFRTDAQCSTCAPNSARRWKIAACAYDIEGTQAVVQFVGCMACPLSVLD